MKEILKEVYQHCFEMQKTADTKNAGLVAFNGAITLTAIKLLIDANCPIWLFYYLVYVLFCTLISIFYNLSAISAQVKHKELELVNHKSKNLLFFGTVANYSCEEYINELRSKYNLKEKPTKYDEDLASQVVINAQIALRKFQLFNYAFKFTISALLSPLGLIIYLLAFDNNK